MEHVALVYPPFGPSALPSLGLSLLSSRIKQAGHDCRCFYWNMEFVSEIGGNDLEKGLAAYDGLTQRPWHPFNEWIFTPALYGMQNDVDEHALIGLLQHSANNGGIPIDAAAVLDLRTRSTDIVTAFADRLADYDIIGIGSTFYQNVPALALARLIKQRWPKKRVILGGANTDGPMGRGLMELFDFLDFVFSGETDRAIVELLDHIDEPAAYQRIPGLLFRKPSGELAEGPKSAPEVRMDDLPLPDFTDYVETFFSLGFGKFRDLVLNMETSRGCWWGAKSHCTFCGLNANGMAYRVKSLDRVTREMAHLKAAYHPRFLFMTDNILSMDYFDTVLQWIQANDLGMDFFYEIKSNLSRRHVRKLAEARVSCVQPGIESFSTSVLKTMRKGVSGAQNVAFLKYAREYGVRLTYNIIVGFPGEDQSAYDRFVEQMPRLVHLQPPSSIPFVEFHRFSPYHDHPDRYGLELIPAPSLKILYPEAGPALADIAYYFVRAELGGRDPSLSYFDKLAEAVFGWIDRFDDSRPLLASQEVVDGIEVHDHRVSGQRATYRLYGAAAEVYRTMDRPQSIVGLRRTIEAAIDCQNTEAAALDDFVRAWFTSGNIPISFDRATFLAEPEACLSLFDEAGLVFVDADPGIEPLYVALAVPFDAAPVSREWIHAQI